MPRLALMTKVAGHCIKANQPICKGLHAEGAPYYCEYLEVEEPDETWFVEAYLWNRDLDTLYDMHDQSLVYYSV